MGGQSFQTLMQYGLAALALIALVILNIWGNPNEGLTTALLTVISATVWGGIQREKGIKVGRDQDPPDK